MNKRVVVITGASSGIGLECARLFASGSFVYNLSRRPCGLKGVTDIKTDVSDELSVKNAFTQIKLEQERVDLLINCAGFGISGAVEFTEVADAKRLFDVNFFGMFLCCKHACALLRKTKGRIINISSEAANFSIPFQGFYSASKSAVNSLTLCIKNELRAFGISVCTVMPGDVKTGFTASRAKSDEGEAVYLGAIEKSVAVMEHDEENGMQPQQIAAFIKKISERKNVGALYTPGAKYKFFNVLLRILPPSAVNRLVGMLYVKS